MARATEYVLRPATPAEVAKWDQLLQAAPGGSHYLQGSLLSSIKRAQGWISIRLVADDAGGPKVPLLVLQRRVPGLGLLWYVPKGPAVREVHAFLLIARATRLYAETLENTPFAIRFEPPLLDTAEVREELSDSGLRKAPNVQADASTIEISVLVGSTEQLAQLGRRARRYIRRAERDGVLVQTAPYSDALATELYGLMTAANQGKGVPGLRTFDYYREFWRAYSDAGQGVFIIAYDHGLPAAGMFLLIFGRTATYKDGGSSGAKTSPGAAYLVQWAAMRFAATRPGVSIYDFMGSPPSDAVEDRDHPYFGVGEFKRAFSKEITDRTGTWDLPIRARQYQIWRRIGAPALLRIFRFLGKSFY